MRALFERLRLQYSQDLLFLGLILLFCVSIFAVLAFVAFKGDGGLRDRMALACAIGGGIPVTDHWGQIQCAARVR